MSLLFPPLFFSSFVGTCAGSTAFFRSFADVSLTHASGLRRGVGGLLRFGTTLEFLISTAVFQSYSVRVLGVRLVFGVSQMFH